MPTDSTADNTEIVSETVVQEEVATPVEVQSQPTTPSKFQLQQRAQRPAPVVARPTVPVQAPAPVIVRPAHTPSQALSALQGKLDNETFKMAEKIDQTDPGLLISLTAIAEYVENMKPGVQIRLGDGVREQIKLYRALVAAVKQTGPLYVYVLNSVLGMFRQHKDGALSWAYMNRFMEEITLSQPERRLFTAMTMIMSELSTPDMAERQSRAKKIFASPHVATLTSVLGDADVSRLRQAMRVD